MRSRAAQSGIDVGSTGQDNAADIVGRAWRERHGIDTG
jgi:hypothetical protein